MPALKTVRVLLEQEIKDLYSAERQLVKALPKMAKAASHPDLAAGFKEHLDQTGEHVRRLEIIAGELGITPRGKTCQAMKGLVEEGSETIQEEGDPAVHDLALIGAAQKVEHYEMAGYGTARTLAESLGLTHVAKTLQQTLDEEGDTDKKLTEWARVIGPQAPTGA